MAKLSLNKAAPYAGVAKSTILEALRTKDMDKRLSAEKNARGHWEIEQSELDRVFPKTPANQSEKPTIDPQTTSQNSALEREVKLLREMLDETKQDRDSWKEQAQKITALIQDQRAKPRFRWFWQKPVG